MRTLRNFLHLDKSSESRMPCRGLYVVEFLSPLFNSSIENKFAPRPAVIAAPTAVDSKLEGTITSWYR